MAAASSATSGMAAAVDQDLIDDTDFTEDASVCTEGVSSVAETSLFGDGDDPDNLVCLVCEERPRLERTVSCTVCAPDVRACRADAKKQASSTGGQQFEIFKKALKFPPQFRALIHDYQSRCAGHGRGRARPPFDWLRYAQHHVFEQGSERGNFNIWMTKAKWKSHIREWEGMEITDHTLNQRWHEELSTLPEGRVSSDRTMLHWPLYPGGYDKGFNRKSQQEVLSMGHKDKRNPTTVDFALRSTWLGHDLQSLGDQAYSKALEYGPGVTDTYGAGQFSKKSGMPDVAFDGAAMQEEATRSAAERKEEKWQAMAAAKPFDGSSQTMLLKPSMVESCKKAKALAMDVLDKSAEAHRAATADTVLAGIIKEGIDSLALRRFVLEALLGSTSTPDETVQDARARWQVCLDDAKVKKAPKGEPCSNLSTLITFTEVKHTLENFKLTSWEQMREEKERLTSTLKQFTDYVKLVSAQAGRISSLVKQEQRKREKEAEKRSKEHQIDEEESS